MKISKKTLAAVAAKKIAVQVKAHKKVAVKVKTVKAKKAAATVTKTETAVAILTGARGILFRSAQVQTMSDGTVRLTALQNCLGLANKDASYAVVKDGKLVNGDNRAGLVAMGGYVNGKTTGASVRLVSEKQALALCKDCMVHWDADDNGVRGKYVGNVSEKGICGVVVQYAGKNFFWQMELDSNANNKHERGDLKSVKEDGKLQDVKF